MNEESNQEFIKKTLSDPLSKEADYATLKAAPELAPTAPTGMSIPAPPIASQPKAPTISAPPTPPTPPTPLATMPLNTGGRIPAPPAVALDLNNDSDTPPAPAPTIKLSAPSAAAPLVLGGAPTQQLPRATTAQPMPASSISSEQTQSFDYAEDESTSGEGFVTFLSIAAVIIALVALAFQLMTANVWLEGDWGRLLE